MFCFLDTTLLYWCFYLKLNKSEVSSSFLLGWNNNFLFYQMDLFLAWRGRLKEREIQICTWKIRICIYLFLGFRKNQMTDTYMLWKTISYDRESLRRDYLNIITLCLTVVLSRQSIMFSYLKFNYTVFIVSHKNIKEILSVNIKEQWMNSLNLQE